MFILGNKTVNGPNCLPGFKPPQSRSVEVVFNTKKRFFVLSGIIDESKTAAILKASAPVYNIVPAEILSSLTTFQGTLCSKYLFILLTN